MPKKVSESLRLARKSIAITNDDYLELTKCARELAFTIKELDKVTTIQTVFESLQKAEKEGKSFNDWKNEVNLDDFQSLAENRKALVYRNFMQTGYNKGKIEQAFNSNKKLKYIAIDDDRVRESHIALDNIVRPAKDSFWEKNLPPNGHNCRCTVRVVPNSTRTTRKDQVDIKLKKLKSDRRGSSSKFDSGFTCKSAQKNFDKLFMERLKNTPRAIRKRFLDKYRTKEAQARRYIEQIRKDIS